MLLNQCASQIGSEVTSVIQAIRSTNVPANMLYEAVGDRLLRKVGTKYHAMAYCSRLHSIVTGSGGAREVAAYLKDLAIDYESARGRMARELRRLREISADTLTQLYWPALPNNLQDSVPTVDTFRLINGSTRTRLARRRLSIG